MSFTEFVYALEVMGLAGIALFVALASCILAFALADWLRI